MARTGRYVVILGLALATTAPAHAFGGRLFGWSSGYQSYYSPVYYSSFYPAFYSPTVAVSYYPTVAYSYYVPTYSYYVPAYTPAKPVVVATAVPCMEPVKIVAPPAVSTFATPMPAPPSQSPEPPVTPKPKVTESSSFYNASATTSYYGGANGLTKVGFWNLTGRAQTIRVNGQMHVVPANQAVTLALPRQFTWQLEQQSPQTESVPSDRASFEIVLR